MNRPGHSGEEVINAIRPHILEWVNMKGGTTFHTTQIISGHGCFGRYLKRIGREDSSRCWHCYVLLDTAKHTLVTCSAWDRNRETLTSIIGNDLSLDAIVSAFLESKEKRAAIISFAEGVMTVKEQAERARREEGGERATAD